MLLGQVQIEYRVQYLGDITPSVFVILYERLLGQTLKDVIREPRGREEEIHNCQTVIDSLSMDVLDMSLSHITGDDIVALKHRSIDNLLEVFSGLAMYILGAIDSDVSSDVEETNGRELPAKYINGTSNLSASSPQMVPERDTVYASCNALPVWEKPQESENVVRSQWKNAELNHDQQIAAEAEAKEANSQLLDDKSLSLVTPDLPQKDDKQFHYVGVRPCVAERKHPRTEGAISSLQTFTHHLFHHTVPPDVTAAQLKYTSNQTKSTQPSRHDASLQSRPAIVKSPASMPRTQHLAQQSAAPVSCPLSDPLSTNNSSRPSSNPSPTILSDIDLKDYSPRVRKTIRSLENQSAMIREISRSPPKPAPRIKQQNVFSRLYQNPIATAVASDFNTSDRRVVELRDSNANSRPSSSQAVSAPNDWSKSVSVVRASDGQSTQNVRQSSETHTHKDMDERSKKKQVQFMTPSPTSVYARTSEDARNKLRKNIEYLCTVYERDLQTLKDDLYEDLDIDRQSAKQIDKEFKKVFLNQKNNSSTKANLAAKKLQPTPGIVKPHKERKRSRSASPTMGHRRQAEEDDLVTALLEEFPYLYISGETWHELWRKGIAQIEQVTRKRDEMRRRKSRAQILLEDADRKQEILHKIMKKQLEHTQRLRDCKAQKMSEIALRNQLRDKRVAIARARRYYDDYQIKMRAKMLKRRTREEMVFKQLFKDGLEIQKERVQDIQDYVKQQKELRNQRQKDELVSIENFYRDQFEILAASVAKDRQDLLIREKAQQKVLDQMKRQLRVKMEQEINEIQDELFRDNDDVYFRQLDADRIRDAIRSASLNISH